MQQKSEITAREKKRWKIRLYKVHVSFRCITTFSQYMQYII